MSDVPELTDALDRRLRAGVRDLADHAPPAPAWDEVRATRPPPARLLPAAAVVVFVVLVLGIGATAGRNDVPSAAPGGNGDATTFAELKSGGGFAMRAEALPDAGLGIREGSAGVWTGSEYLVWGGWRGGTPANDGAAYDPTTNTWRPIPPAPIAGRREHVAVWTGGEMIVWGGTLGSRALGARSFEGAAFDPATNTWRRLADAPSATEQQWLFDKAIWFDGRLVVVDRSGATEGAPLLVYDAAADRWDRFDVGTVRDVTVASSMLIGVLDADPMTGKSVALARIDAATGDVSPIGTMVVSDYTPSTRLASDGRLAVLVVPEMSTTRVGWFDPVGRRWTNLFRTTEDQPPAFVQAGMNPDAVASQIQWMGGELAVLGSGTLATIDPSAKTLNGGQLNRVHCVQPNNATVWTGREWFTFGGLGSCGGDAVEVAGHAARVTFGESP